MKNILFISFLFLFACNNEKKEVKETESLEEFKAKMTEDSLDRVEINEQIDLKTKFAIEFLKQGKTPAQADKMADSIEEVLFKNYKPRWYEKYKKIKASE
jgi:ATP-dependent protease HslVU (ClpYQ) ATPase subunit